MSYFFTSEAVSQGHPDIVADEISSAIVDRALAFDPESHCAIETMVTAGQVIVGGELKTNTIMEIPNVVRACILRIGYNRPEYRFNAMSCGILNAIHEQSPDIDRGIIRSTEEETGTGDQGIMFGYATNETENCMPATLEIANMLVRELALIREANESCEVPEGERVMTYLCPDAKSEVTIEYDDKTNKPIRISTIVISTSHSMFDDERLMHDEIEYDIRHILIPRVIAKCDDKLKNLFNDDIKYYINPLGEFVLFGPAADTGMTGRKIIATTYGGWGTHGGGCATGKDGTKVDVSGLYATRHIAKNSVKAGVADRMLVQVAYAIGVASPVSFFVNTYGTNHTSYSDSEIARKLMEIVDLRPFAVIRDLKLKAPLYSEAAAYGHFGREPKTVHKTFINRYGEVAEKDVELFTWEKLDLVDRIKEVFKL